MLYACLIVCFLVFTYVMFLYFFGFFSSAHRNIFVFCISNCNITYVLAIIIRYKTNVFPLLIAKEGI